VTIRTGNTDCVVVDLKIGGADIYLKFKIVIVGL
jgi:hypothetical protein